MKNSIENKELNNRVKEWIKFICEVLMVQKPDSIKYGAECHRIISTDPNQKDDFGYILKLPKTNEPLRYVTDYFFDLAHEIRHAYQFQQVHSYMCDDKYNLELYPDEIKEIKNDINELHKWEKETRKTAGLSPNYNLRYTECDANAFAELMMNFFGVEITWMKFRNDEPETKEIKNKIEKCKKEILSIITLEDISAAATSTGIDIEEYRNFFIENVKNKAE